MKMLVLVGCMASGKDKLLNKLIKENEFLTPVISTTNRPKRVGEKQGVTYNFVSDEEMKSKSFSDFIEYRQYKVADDSMWTYGIEKSSINLDGDNFYITIVDFQGLKQLEKYIEDNGLKNSIVSVFVDCPAEERVERAINREFGLTDEQVNEICRRTLDDYKNVLPAREYCQLKIDNSNGNFDYCITTLNRIINCMR